MRCVTVAILIEKKPPNIQLADTTFTYLYLLNLNTVFLSLHLFLCLSVAFIRFCFSILLTHFTPLLFHRQFHYGDIDWILSLVWWYITSWRLFQRRRKIVPIRVVRVNINKMYVRETYKQKNIHASHAHTLCIVLGSVQHEKMVHMPHCSLRSLYFPSINFFCLLLLLVRIVCVRITCTV